MILTFVKKYEELDPILQSYEQVGRDTACSWKLAQKIIHSFESLIVFEPRCVKYSKDFRNVDQFLDFVFEKDICDNVLVKKASSQVLLFLYRHSPHLSRTSTCQTLSQTSTRTLRTSLFSTLRVLTTSHSQKRCLSLNANLPLKSLKMIISNK